MSSCAIKPYCTNSKGESVESRLYNDLLQHTSDRKLSNKFYLIGTNKEFLDGVRDRAKFDENGEITFNSLRKLAKLNIEEEKIRESADRELKSGNYSYTEAIQKANVFNESSQFNDDYLATISPSDNGKAYLHLVSNNANNRQKLKKLISKRMLRDRLINRLNEAGVYVDFLDHDDRIHGRYSTENIEKAVDGLYHLIQIAHGEKVTRTLAEEAGHFAIASLGKNPLVQRLQTLLTPDVQQNILGEEYSEKILGADGRREVAGTLVGRALMEEVDKENIIGRLAYRISNLAKKVFAVLKGDQVTKDKIVAEDSARQIAKKFMSDNELVDINQALETKETLYDADHSLESETYKKIINNLTVLADKLRTINREGIYTNIYNILGSSSIGRTSQINMSPNNIFSNTIAMQGIGTAIDQILDIIGPGKEVNRLLDEIDFSNDIDFVSSMITNGSKLRQVHEFAFAIASIQKILQDSLTMLEGKESIPDVVEVIIDGKNVNLQLNVLNRQLAEANEYIVKAVITKERQFFQRFLEQFYGKSYVETSSKLVWNINRKLGSRRIKNTEGKTKFIRLQDGKRYDLSALLTDLEDDITCFERFLGSMSNNSDIIGQIADKVAKEANHNADRNTEEVYNKLRISNDVFKTLGIKTIDVLERDENGKLTGNFLSKYNYGILDREYQKFKDNAWNDFVEKHDISYLSEIEKAYYWDSYFRPLHKSWKKEHYDFSKEDRQWIPKDKYKNSEYIKLMNNKAIAEWYKEFIDIKESLDRKLPEGSTEVYRMPQFRGNTINRIRNKSGNKLTAIFKIKKAQFFEAICEDITDEEFGSNLTYNSNYADPFENALAMEKERINRLPIFGINRIKNTEELSTDIFGSMLSYASMANTYEAMNTVVDCLEVGKNTLLERRVNGMLSERERLGNKSRAFNRYSKFLDKQIYQIGSTKTSIEVTLPFSKKERKFVIEKLVGAMSGMASKYFLGGNVMGGIVNTGTGTLEVFKEAMSGEFFGMKDWKRAHEIYFKYLPSALIQGGLEYKDNKLDQFIRYFNAFGDTKGKSKKWNTQDTNRILNLFNSSLYMPYKSGDHYMQSLVYMAIGSKTFIYDEDGNKKSLWDAYESYELEDSNKNRKTYGLRGTWYKTKEAKQEVDLIGGILNKIQDKLESNSDIKLTTTEEDYLNKEEISLENLKKTQYALAKKLDSLLWTRSDESEFMDKCREINNRLHGVYNNQDKTALHQQWFFNAFLAMKGYALGMINRRYGSSKHSIALGKDVEGSMNTFGKLVANNILTPRTYLRTAQAVLLPYSKGASLFMQEQGFNSNQIANMKRNFGDLLLLGILYTISSMFSRNSIGGDDDDKKEYSEYIDNEYQIEGLVYYFANRLYREQAAFNMPNSAYKESSSLLDLQPVGLAALSDMVVLGYQGIGAVVGDRDDSDFFYQSSKEGKYEKHEAKVWLHFKNRFPYWRSWYSLTHPYEAAKAYEYGKTVKAR